MLRTPVLVLEHDPLRMQQLLSLFQAAGYAPLLAPDASTALAFLEREHFDVVVTDDGSAEMGADELVRALRASDSRRAPPVVRMTDARAVKEPSLFAAVLDRSTDPISLLIAVARVIGLRCRADAPSD